MSGSTSGSTVQSSCSLIIAGTRDFGERFSLWLDNGGASVVQRAIAASSEVDGNDVDCVLSGTARGPDQWGEQWAEQRDGVSLDRYPADWDAHGDDAGPIRNAEMARDGDALIAFWDGESTGTGSMIAQARKRDLDITVIRMDNEQVREAVLTGTVESDDDDDDSDDDDSGTDLTRPSEDDKLEQLTQVGGVRAHRIRRDTELDSIQEVAEADSSDLKQVWSVGPHYARVIIRSAQERVERWEVECCAEFSTDERVAVVVPSPYEGIDPDEDIYSVLDEAGLETDEQMDLITECVRDAGVNLRTDDVRILAAEDATNVINWWHEGRAQTISLEGTGEVTTEFQEVDTPWDKYVDDVNYKAAQDRNEELVRRANKVVIVCEGPYTDNLLDEIESQSTEHGGAVECHAQYTFDPSRPESGLLDWDPAEETEYDVRTYDVSDAETYGRPSSTYTGPGSYETRVKVTVDGPSGETEHDIGWLNDMNVDVEVGNTFEFSGAEWTIIGMKEVPVDDSESEQSDPDGLNIEETESSADVERDDDDSVPDVAGPLPDDRGEPAREGSVPELEPDGEREHLTQEPAASIDEDSRIDENDLEDGDPGGGKVDEYVETSGLS